jgi:hypothetical protein
MSSSLPKQGPITTVVNRYEGNFHVA